MEVKIEVCIESIESARTAEKAGAHRLELNSAIGLGGLTPTLTLIQHVKSSVNIPVICMVRPRPGDFHYTAEEFEWIVAESKATLSAGADGIAIGFLSANGSVDIERTKRVREICAQKELVFHRAFDCTPDLPTAASQLVEIGVDRVLTSGGQATAINGMDQIALLQSLFGDRIELLPGSGIHHDNVGEILQKTGCQQVHGTFRSIVSTGSKFVPDLNFNECIGLNPADKYETSAEEIIKVWNAIHSQAN